jgi:hypothetical protein
MQALLVVVGILLAAQLVRAIQAAPPAAAQEVAPVLRARAIELVNAEGQVVGQLYTGEDGAGNLRLRSADGAVRVKLGATDDGSGLLLLDRDVQPAVVVATDAEGTSVTLAERGRRARVIRPRRASRTAAR